MKFAWVIRLRRVFVVLLLLLPAVGCNRPRAKQFALRGNIVGIEAQGQMAMIHFEKVEGWMDPMTMEFRVKNAREFRALHVGDQISAKLFVLPGDYWIEDIQDPAKAP